MKLPGHRACQPVRCFGNLSRLAVMGEAKWMDFRTRVRFPPGPLATLVDCKSPFQIGCADGRLAHLQARTRSYAVTQRSACLLSSVLPKLAPLTSFVDCDPVFRIGFADDRVTL